MRPQGPLARAKQIELLPSGPIFFTRFCTMLQQARTSIHLQFYIFSDDVIGHTIVQLLQAKAAEQVAVSVLIDGFGSSYMSRKTIRQLRQAGVRVRKYGSFSPAPVGYFARRMHQKLVVVDAKEALIGGLNIDDKYTDGIHHHAWLDFAVYLKSTHLPLLEQLCLHWLQDPSGKSIRKLMTETPVSKTGNGITYSVCINDWINNQTTITDTYRQLFLHAQQSVLLVGSYFIPGRKMRTYINRAAERNVSIRIIIAGKSDVWIAKSAERWLYDWLLRKNVQIYELQSNILHGKMAISDRDWMTIGSYNVNNISAYASVEVNINVYDHRFVNHSLQTLENILTEKCLLITPDLHQKNKTVLIQFIRWLSYQVYQLLFFLFTFYFRRLDERPTIRRKYR
jgi:cardiolipin synthase